LFCHGYNKHQGVNEINIKICNTNTVMWDPTEKVNKNYNIILRAAFYLQLKSVFILKMAYFM